MMTVEGRKGSNTGTTGQDDGEYSATAWMGGKGEEGPVEIHENQKTELPFQSSVWYDQRATVASTEREL